MQSSELASAREFAHSRRYINAWGLVDSPIERLAGRSLDHDHA